jgi:S1-C subfamily serine protease
VSRRGPGESLGSAVVYTNDGFLLTNAHVVGQATSGMAAFWDGTSVPSRVVGADPLSDLAVLRATGDTPEPAVLGEADALVVGQLVVAAVAGIGLGLAVPVNATTRRIMSTLMRDGRVRRAYLGLAVAPAPVAAPWRERIGRMTGLRVASIVPGSPADRAGLCPGDLLLTTGRQEVAPAQDLQRLMFAEAIGRPLAITVMRNGALVDVIAEPSELVAA